MFQGRFFVAIFVLEWSLVAILIAKDIAICC